MLRVIWSFSGFSSWQPETKPVLKLCNTVSQSQDKNPVHQAKLKDECQTGPSNGQPDCREYRSDRGDGMEAVGVKRLSIKIQ